MTQTTTDQLREIVCTSLVLIPYERQSNVDRNHIDRLTAILAAERLDELDMIYRAYPFDEEDSIVDAKRQARGEESLDTLPKYLDKRIEQLKKQVNPYRCSSDECSASEPCAECAQAFDKEQQAEA